VDVQTIALYIDYGVFGILGLMSFLTFWLYVERLLFFKNVDVAKYPYKEQLEIDLTNNVSIIASFGSNAVYSVF